MKKTVLGFILGILVAIPFVFPSIVSAARTGVQSVSGYFTTSPTNAINVYYNSGSVGIGTSAPTANGLSVVGRATSTPTDLFTVASSTGQPYFRVTDTGSVLGSYFTSTTTTATSTFANAVSITGANSFLLVSTTTPGFGPLAFDNIEAGGSVNQGQTITSFNNSSGNCALAGFVGVNSNASLVQNYFILLHTSTGYTGIGCPAGGPYDVNSTLLYDPIGNIGFGIASTSATSKFQWMTGATQSTKMVLTNDGNLGIGTTTPQGLLTVSKAPQGNGTTATTTIEWGDMATTTSAVCVNTKNSAGVAMSFYFNASNSIVTSSSRCN